MKRWPQVSSPAVRWPNLNGTTWPSKTQRIECSGRTQRRALLPQRIDFGHGREASASGRLPSRTAVVAVPLFWTTANQTPPLQTGKASGRDVLCPAVSDTGAAVSKKNQTISNQQSNMSGEH